MGQQTSAGHHAEMTAQYLTVDAKLRRVDTLHSANPFMTRWKYQKRHDSPPKKSRRRLTLFRFCW